MRRGEVLGLEWRDVGPVRLAVRRSWTRGRLRPPKGGTAREIPMLAAEGDEMGWLDGSAAAAPQRRPRTPQA